jgi:hypothetical protein
MRKMLIAALVLTMLPITAFSQAKISGDVRVRPRMDVTDADGSGGDDAVTKQLILYWGRLNVDADIGGGWSFHSKLASNWVGHWAGYMGSQEVGNDVGLGNDRPTISWMELSFGKKTDNWGFRAGNLPLNGVANHIVDLHYYATSRGPVDIPWAIYHVQSIQGFNGFANLGPGKLNFALSVDANLNTDAGDGLVNRKTLMADYGAAFGGITVKPQMAMTMDNDSTAAPMTMGAGVSAKVAGFTLSGTYLMTSNTVEGSGKYDGSHIRAGVKGNVGPGFLLAWYDIASVTPDGGDATDYSFLWLLYKYTVHSSDKGSMVVMPTIRMRTGAPGNTDYSRNKFELTCQLNFK